jgi:tetratricopeptide (TPR) repeat protein
LQLILEPKIVKSDYDKAIELYTRQLTISQELGDKQGIGSACGRLGDVYRDKGDYDKAKELYTKHLTISQELGDKRGIGSAGGRLGHVYYSKGDYDKATELYTRAITIAVEMGDKYLLMGYYHQLAWIRIKLALACRDNNQSIIHDALKYAQKAYTLAEELDSKEGVASAYLKYGIIYGETKEFEKADEYFTKGITIYTDSKQKKNLADACYHYAEMLMKSGNKGKALEQYNKALVLYKEMKLDHKVKEVEKAIGEMQ